MMPLLIAISTMFLSLQSIIQKSYNNTTNPNKIGMLAFNVIVSISALIVFMISPKEAVIPNANIFVYALGFAVAYFCCIFFQLKAIKEGALSITALIMSYSLIIPTLYGVIFLNENLNILKSTGIILLLISIYLVAGKNEKNAISKKWLIYVVIAFIGNGLCTCIQKAYLLQSMDKFKTEFMIIALFFVLIGFIISCMTVEKKLPVPKLKNGGAHAALFGLVNAGVNLSVMIMAKFPASIVFPTISAGSIVITFFISKFVYKEQLNAKQNIGFIIGTLSIILLNI